MTPRRPPGKPLTGLTGTYAELRRMRIGRRWSGAWRGSRCKSGEQLSDHGHDDDPTVADQQP